MNYGAALKNYNDVKVNASASAASPHQLIQMLYDGLIERIAQAKGGIEQKDFEAKGRRISQAISIVLGLKSNLDLDKGGDLATRLNDLYDYIRETLWSAHVKNDASKLDECIDLVTEMSITWKKIG